MFFVGVDPSGTQPGGIGQPVPASGVPASDFPGVPASVVPPSVFAVAKAGRNSASDDASEAGGDGQVQATAIDWGLPSALPSPSGAEAPWQPTAMKSSPSNPRSVLSVCMTLPG